MTALDGATCPKHAGAASDVCTRCGRFICPACTLRVGAGDEARIVCEECAPRMAGLFGGSWLSVGSAICGFLSLCLFPLGLVAVVLGVIDLVRAASADGPRGGKTLDAAGIALGAVGTVVGVVVLLRALSTV